MSGGDDEVAQLIDRRRVREALGLLVKEHGSAVYTRCLRILRDAELARDVAQQTFLEALRDLPGFERRSTFKTWLTGIATHRSIDALRAGKRRQARIVDDPDVPANVDDPSGVDPAESAQQQQRWQALVTCLAQLSPEARAAVLLRYRDDLSYEEMSAVLGEKAGTLQARVARTMPALRECMTTKGFEA